MIHSPSGSPGKSMLGIMPGHIYNRGPVGLISRSGTLGYEAAAQAPKNAGHAAADAGDEQDSRIWQRSWARRSLFWLALIALMATSTVLEWSRLYRLEALLPGHAGGVLGHGLGAFSMRWLGFTGSALTMLALLQASRCFVSDAARMQQGMQLQPAS